MSDQTLAAPSPEPYDDGTPASLEQVEALWRQLREFSEQLDRDRRRFRDNEVSRLTALRDAEADPSVRAGIQQALDRVLAPDHDTD